LQFSKGPSDEENICGFDFIFYSQPYLGMGCLSQSHSRHGLYFHTEDEYDDMMDNLLGDDWTLSDIGPLNSAELNNWLANVFAERMVRWHYTPQSAKDTWETTTSYYSFWDNQDLAPGIKLKLTWNIIWSNNNTAGKHGLTIAHPEAGFLGHNRHRRFFF
jgi:hypothetical protein